MRLSNNNTLSLLFILAGIIIGYFINLENISQSFLDLQFKEFNTSNINFSVNVFLYILSKNLIVALLLSIGGYFSSGILTIIILFANGYYLGIYFTYYHYSNISIVEFLSFFIYHGIIEFYAFFILSKIGYSGFDFYKKILKDESFSITLKFSQFRFPFILLAIAAIIESFLISTF